MTLRIDWLTGVGTALVTPFHRDGSVDVKAFGLLAERQIAGGVKILVPCGTTGESVTMGEAERLQVIRISVEVAHGKAAGSKPKRRNSGSRSFVLAGTGSNSTAATIDFTRKAREAGADGALIVAPYYNKPTQAGLYAHYSEVARSVKGFPIVLYNVPGRTASNISAETTLRLAAEHDNIVGTKEASGNFSQVMEIIAGRPKNFKVLSGDDATAVPLIALGADGLVSVVSNEMPKETVKMVEHALNGSFHFARKIHYKILPLMEANFIESSPAPCKFVMKELGLLEENLRLPLVPVTKPTRELLLEAMAASGIRPNPKQ
jgi:4-hydroxy-tetrahydrodipicolinate synthase